MSVTNTIRIGADVVDISRPCDVAAALRKMQLKLAAGGVRETVRVDGEEVTFHAANDRRLSTLIKKYEADCARISGGGVRTRFAKRFSFK